MQKFVSATNGVVHFRCAVSFEAATFLLLRDEIYWIRSMMELAKRALSKYSVGRNSEVKNLFTGYDWEQLSMGERSSFGKYFSGAVRMDDCQWWNVVKKTEIVTISM